MRAHVSMTTAIGLVLVAAGAVGCSTGRSPGPELRAYPAEVPRGENTNIQIFRRGTHIEFTNTTPSTIPACTMWVNMRFGRPIDALPIGASASIDLREFRDEHADAFRGGGFFASNPPQALVLAQFETVDASGAPVFLGTTVVGGGAE